MHTGRLFRSYPRRDLPRVTHPDAFRSLSDLGLDSTSETLLWVDDGAVEARLRASMVELEELRVAKEQEDRKREKERLAAEKKRKTDQERIDMVRREIEEDRLRRIAKQSGSALAELDKPSIPPRALLANAEMMPPSRPGPGPPTIASSTSSGLSGVPVPKKIYIVPTASAPPLAASASSLPNRPHDHVLASAPAAQVTTLRILGNARIRRHIKTMLHDQDPHFATESTTLRDVFQWIRDHLGPMDDVFELWLHAPPGERGSRELRGDRVGHHTLEELGLGVVATVWYQRL